MNKLKYTKRFTLLFFTLILCVTCTRNKEVSPNKIWSAGCAVFSAHENGYKLSGMCCEELIIPRLKIRNGNTFSAKATFHSSKGEETTSVATVVKGKVSEDGKTIDMQYEVSGKEVIYKLDTDAGIIYCSCGCG